MRSQAAGRPLRRGGAAGRRHREGPAPIPGHPGGARPVHLRSSVTTVESPLTPGPARAGHPEAARPHRRHAAGEAGGRRVDAHPPLLRAGRGGAGRRGVAAAAARHAGGVPLRLGLHARLQRAGPPGHRPPHVLAPPLRPGRRAVPVLDRHLLPASASRASTATPRADMVHLLYLFGTGYYQLYYLLVLLEFYALFPLLLVLLRRTAGHHGLVLLASGWRRSCWCPPCTGAWCRRGCRATGPRARSPRTSSISSPAWWSPCTSTSSTTGSARTCALIVAGTLAAAVAAEVWYYLAADHVASWLGSSSDPFQPIVIPFNIGAIACIYLIGVALVHRRRSKRTRTVVQSGSDNSYGIYLAQLLFITILGWLGWRHLNGYLPWPLVSVITVVVVFLACIGLTELLARTPLAKPLTGRTQVPWRRTSAATAAELAAAPRRRGRRAPSAIRSRRPRRRSRPPRRQWRTRSCGSRHRRGAGCGRAAGGRTSTSARRSGPRRWGTVPRPGHVTGSWSVEIEGRGDSAMGTPADR